MSPDDVRYGDQEGFYWHHALDGTTPYVRCWDVVKFIKGWALKMSVVGDDACAEAMQTTARELEIEWTYWLSQQDGIGDE